MFEVLEPFRILNCMHPDTEKSGQVWAVMRVRKIHIAVQRSGKADELRFTVLARRKRFQKPESAWVSAQLVLALQSFQAILQAFEDLVKNVVGSLTLAMPHDPWNLQEVRGYPSTCRHSSFERELQCLEFRRIPILPRRSEKVSLAYIPNRCAATVLPLTHDSIFIAEKDFHPLSKSTAVGIAACAGVAESFHYWICFKNSLLN